MQPDLIEGSKAREEARSKLPHLFEVFGGDKPLLGDPAVIDAVLRGFFVRVSELRIEVHKEKMTGTECVNALRELSRKTADKFMGRTEEYARQSWFSVDQLGAYLDQICTGAGGKEQAAEAFFLHLASRAFEIMRAHEEEEIDDEVAKFRIDVLIEDARQALLGLELQEQEEE